MIAEDSVLLRDGLVRLLAEDGHEVVAVAGDAAELVAAVERERRRPTPTKGSAPR